MNIYCGYREAMHHETTGDKDLSKGPLKYTGRALDQLCEIQGRKPYAQLTPEERLDVVASVFEPGAMENPARRKVCERVVKTLDRLPDTLAEAKRLGAKAAGDSSSRIPAESGVARIFLRQAAAKTVGQLAREALNPPYDPAFIDEMIRSQNWNKLNARQRNALARRLDENYRKAVSAMAMTDLLAVTWTLHTMDLAENDPHGNRPGRMALRQLIEAESNPKMRKLLELAEEHGRLHVTAECSNDPKARTAARNRMSTLRTQLFAAAAEAPSPGQTIIERAAEMGPRSYTKRLKDGARPSWDVELPETRGRLNDLLTRMVGDEETASLRQKLKLAIESAKPMLSKAYMKERLRSEVFSLGSIADGLTLIELYQQGASNADLASAFGIQVVSRAHWSIGFLRAAAHLDLNDEDGWKALGKEAAFWTAAHYLPQVMGTMKLVFDIELGLIKVTLLPAMNALDDALIDALYTGVAGRTKEGLANWGSRYREGIDAILDGKLIVRTTDAKTGKVTVDIDRMQLFRDKAQQWFSLPYDDSRLTIVSPDPLIKAYASYLKIQQEQLESQEATWLVAGEFRPAPLPDKGQVREAFDRFRTLVAHKCETDVDRVLSESAARKSIRFREPEDRIRAGLIERYSSDILLGMEWTLQTDLAEQAMARRQLERTAALADMEQLAKTLSAAFDPPDGKDPAFELDVGVEHPAVSRVFDGTEPLPLTCQLRLSGNRPANMSDALLDISPGPVTNLTDKNRAPKAGDMVRGPVTIRALVGGKEIASKTVELTVKLGAAKPTCRFTPVNARAPGEPIGLGLQTENGPRHPRKTKFRYDFGDGQTTESETWESHVYEKAGTYTVTIQWLDVTDKTPKLLGKDTAKFDVQYKDILKKLHAMNGVEYGLTYGLERVDGEKKAQVAGGFSNRYGGQAVQWSGTSFSSKWHKESDHPNGLIEDYAFTGTLSDNGRTVIKASAKFTSRQKNGGFKYEQSFDLHNLAVANIGGSNEPDDVAVFAIQQDKLAADVRNFKLVELRFDRNDGKVWNDKSAKNIFFKSGTLHGAGVVFRKLPDLKP